MPRGRIWPGMRLVGGIEMRASGTGIGCAAIAKFMDMKAVLTGRQARDLCVREFISAFVFRTGRHVQSHQ
jgi:hypothetical protein